MGGTARWGRGGARLALLPRAALTALAAAASLGSRARGAAARGAAVPYVRYEAEDGVASGAATVVGPNRLVGDLGGEASGRRAVRLASPGDGVAWRVAEKANSVVVRYCIPDSADGKGIDATISVYVNGRRRDAIDLTSRYAWLYGNEAQPCNDPSAGGPRHIYDESHKLFSFVVRKGDEIMLKKDPADAAGYCGIDFVELEMVAPPAPCPPGFVNTADAGITEENFGSKFGALLWDFNRIDPYKGKKGIYIPAGRYRMESIAMVHNHTPGLEIRGAGMWHTVLYDLRGNHADWGTPGFNLNGVAVRFSDFAMLGGSNSRQGNGKPFNNCYGDGTVMRNIWVEHMTCGFWVGGSSGVTNRLTIDGCRLRNLGADGINLCNGTKNSTVVNTTVRSSGDDGIAIWSAREHDGPAGGVDYPGCAGNVVRNCTVELPWRASGIAIYGGGENTVRDCVVRDTLTYPGVNVSSTFNPRPFEGRTLVENVLVERCGGAFWSGQRFGALWVMADDLPVPGVEFRDVDVTDPTYSGIMLKSETYNKPAVREMDVVFENVTVSRPGAEGILVQDAMGKATFRNTRLLEVPGRAVLRNRDTNGKTGTGTIKLVTDDRCVGIGE